MARFDDFKQLEQRVIREALTGAQSEFYDPGHTKEDRDTLEALIREVEDKDLPFTFGEPVKPVLDIGIPTPAQPERISITVKAEKAQEPPRNAKRRRRSGGRHTRPPGQRGRPAGPQGPPRRGRVKPAFYLSGAPIAATSMRSVPDSLSRYTAAKSAEATPR